MTNVVTEYVDGNTEDDGFSGSIASGRVLKGTLLKWTDSTGWVDRDGLAPGQPLLVIAINEILQRWKDNKPEVIPDKPLPDPEDLNAAIPLSEWEKGIDGKPRPPWAKYIVVYLVDLGNGAFYTFTTSTTGGRMAFDHLRESVITMRAFRGTKCMPVVNLTDKPFKTSFGLRKRPFFDIIGWRTPGGETPAVANKPTPQIQGPAAGTQVPQATPAPATAPPKQARQPKQPVSLSDYTLAVMGEPAPVTMGEELDDEIPW
jgi:hypothetical protein